MCEVCEVSGVMCWCLCSDGVSRTGTFLTIHCQVERLKSEGVVDFLQAIKSARLQRPGIVSNTVSQILHKALFGWVNFSCDLLSPSLSGSLCVLS